MDKPSHLVKRNGFRILLERFTKLPYVMVDSDNNVITRFLTFKDATKYLKGTDLLR